MFYEYVGSGTPFMHGVICPIAAKGECPVLQACGDDGCVQVKSLPVSKAPKIGKSTPCQWVQGGVMARVYSLPNVIIKGETLIDWNPGQSVRTNINGQDVRLTFVDHPHTDPQVARQTKAMSERMGIRSNDGMGKAYFNEKYGRMCVDVASNVPDPLGGMEKEKRKGNVISTKMPVNQPYKTRSKKK